MPSVGDVVRLGDGSVGVISEELARVGLTRFWRVEFPDSRLDVAAGYISQTLSAPTYTVGDTIEVWPHLGTVQAVNSSEVTVELERSERIEGVGHIEWTPNVTVPLWRIILDNDTRLERVIE